MDDNEIAAQTRHDEIRELKARASGCAVAVGYALVGRCDTCGNINAVDLDGTPEHEREMQHPGRTVKRVTEAEALRLWKLSARCEHKSMPPGAVGNSDLDSFICATPTTPPPEDWATAAAKAAQLSFPPGYYHKRATVEEFADYLRAKLAAAKDYQESYRKMDKLYDETRSQLTALQFLADGLAGAGQALYHACPGIGLTDRWAAAYAAYAAAKAGRRELNEGDETPVVPSEPASRAKPAQSGTWGDRLKENRIAALTQSGAELAAEEIDRLVRQFTGHTGALPDFAPQISLAIAALEREVDDLKEACDSRHKEIEQRDTEHEITLRRLLVDENQLRAELTAAKAALKEGKT